MAQALQQRAQVLLPNLPDPIQLNISMCCNKLDTNRPHSQTPRPKRNKQKRPSQQPVFLLYWVRTVWWQVNGLHNIRQLITGCICYQLRKFISSRTAVEVFLKGNYKAPPKNITLLYFHRKSAAVLQNPHCCKIQACENTF